MRNLLFCLVSIMAIGTVRAATASDAPIRIDLGWRASIDVQGHVTELQAIPNKRVDRVPAIRQRLEQEIRTWSFLPGTVNGQAEPTQTGLNVHAELTVGANDTVQIRITHAGVGGTTAKAAPPRYPVAAIRTHKTGEVVLRIAYDANGQTIAASPAPGSPAASNLLIEASEKAAHSWTFQPEVVGGHAMAGAVVVPFCYTLHPMGTNRVEGKCDWKAPGRSDAMKDGEALALNPAAKLLTDVAGRTL